MVKTFELLHKALLIFGFWSFILLVVHFFRGESEVGWVLTFANYFTSILACTFIIVLACIGFYIMHYKDYQKKLQQFKDTEIDGFKSNIGQPFRVIAPPKKIENCEALDLHALYFTGGEIYRKSEEKEQAELKLNEDSEKIADLLVEKLTLTNEIKSIQATLINYVYSRKTVEDLKKQEYLSKHDSTVLADLENNIAAIDETKLKKRISTIKAEINVIEDQVHEISGEDVRSEKTSEVEDNNHIMSVVDSINQNSSGYTMYGSEDVNVEKYREHNKKGLLYYRHIFNELYSSLSAEKRNEVDRNIANLMESLPNFTYTGVVSTTPKIKKVKDFDLDLKSYQLSIFTAFFPIFTWLELRESVSVSKLELRDKRMLWGAKRMYDIYVKRDADLKKKKISDYSIPLKDYKGGYRLAHDEFGCLVELWRFVENAKLVEVKETNRAKVSTSVTNHDLIELVKNLLSEEDRINGGNRDKRIGFWYDKKLFLEWDKFMVEARLLFVNYYHNEAQKVKNLDALIFNALKEEDYLAMEIKDKFKPLDEGTLHDNGELFDVTWESIKGGGDSDKETISKGTLVLKIRSAFRRIPQTAKKGSNAATKFTVSEHSSIKGTPFGDSRDENEENAAKGRELLDEQIRQSRSAVEAETEELSKLAEQEKNKPINVTEIVKREENNSNSMDDFMQTLMNSPDQPTQSEDKGKDTASDDVDSPSNESNKDDDDNDKGSSFKLEAEKLPEKKTEQPKAQSSTRKNKGQAKKKAVVKNAFDTDPIDVVEDKIPKEKQGLVIEVKQENSNTPTYFIQDLNNHLEKIDSRSRSERSFLSRVYLDRLRFQILSNQIEVKGSEGRPYWQLRKEQILELIPTEMQLHLLTQPKIESLYEVISQPLQNKPAFKDQKSEIEKIINSPIKRIRSINLMKISHSPEIDMYKSQELITVRPNDLSRFVAQLEEKCFQLQKSRNKNIEFNPTPSSNTHYGVYRILATNSNILGDLGATLKNYCAYKHKMGFKHIDDEIAKDLDTFFCINLEASNKTIFVFFAPKRAGSKYLEHIDSAIEKANSQGDMLEELMAEGVTDASMEVSMTISESELKKTLAQKNTKPLNTKKEVDTPIQELKEPDSDTPDQELKEPDSDTPDQELKEPDSDTPDQELKEPDFDTPDQGLEEPDLESKKGEN